MDTYHLIMMTMLPITIGEGGAYMAEIYTYAADLRYGEVTVHVLIWQ